MVDTKRAKNGFTLWFYYIEEFNAYFDGEPPYQQKVGIILLGKLIRAMGKEEAITILNYSLENWETIRKKFKIKDKLPLPNIIYGFREGIQILMNRKEELEVANEKAASRYKALDISKDIF